MNQPLPVFKYHPDPIATGSIEPSEQTCICCEEQTGYIYAGPVYAEEDLDEQLCPWCIANGTAHERFDAEFTDPAGIGGDDEEWDEVDEEIIEEVAFRTPGFTGWQQEKWWAHCGDAGAFLGRVGYNQAKELGLEFLKRIAEEAGYDSVEEAEEFLESLNADGNSTAYAFRCLKCGTVGGYSDCD